MPLIDLRVGALGAVRIELRRTFRGPCSARLRIALSASLSPQSRLGFWPDRRRWPHQLAAELLVLLDALRQRLELRRVLRPRPSIAIR